MRIACVGYRDWALGIYDALAKDSAHEFLIIRREQDFSEQALDDFKPDWVLFYGWSQYVPSRIYHRYCCLMLHPSPLPLYRGGSPIQNQIINGEKQSKVTIFIMAEEMDAGDIVAQDDLSLEGSLDEIFMRIQDSGIRLTQQLLRDGLKPAAQDHARATHFPRRKPTQSEITHEELATASAEYLYNKIRMLGDPYPNAFIRTADGKKLLIKAAAVEKDA